MKRIATLVLCLLLTASAFLISYIPVDYSAGKGNGKDEEVKTVETLSSVLLGTYRLLDTAVTPTSYSEANEENTVYESVTLSADAIGEYDVSYGSTDCYYYFNSKIKVYIDSEGKTVLSYRDTVTTVNYSSPQGSSYVHCTYDADLYFNDGVCAIKYYDFSFNGLSEKDILGKWIDVDSIDGEHTALFDTGIQSLKDWLSLIDKYITNYRNEAFNESENKLTMNEEYLNKFILDEFKISSENAFGNSYNYKSDDSKSMEIDLSDRHAPTITTSAENVRYTGSVYENAGDTSTVQLSARYTLYQKITLENINNTVIDFDESKIGDFYDFLFG